MCDSAAKQARIEALLEELEMLQAENARLARQVRMLQASVLGWYARVRGAHKRAVMSGDTELAEYLRNGE
jgi:hypothetical protein